MKLAILVVYLASQEQGKLLRLHLQNIYKFTTVPYVIYAATNRLIPELLPILQNTPNVKICNLHPTDLTGSLEHQYYLEKLTEQAILDNVSHLVTLHVDSFPIRTGWVEILAQKLTDDCVLVTTKDINTACFMFRRQFYLDLKPTYMPTEIEQMSELFQKYLQEIKPIRHTGIGYGFRAYQNKLTHHYMNNTILEEDRAIGFEIYDHLIFHFGGSARLAFVNNLSTSGKHATLSKIFIKIRELISPRTRAFLINILYNSPLPKNITQKIHNISKKPRAQLLNQFIEDPEKYIEK